jgi:HEAT repeat protein
LIDSKSFLDKFDDLSEPELIERLHRLYPTVDKKTRIKFLVLLNKLGDNSHFDTIENYFISDEDAEVRIEAAKLLAFNYKRKRAIKPLIWVIKNEENRDVKFTALRLLVALSYKEKFRDTIIETLKELLTSKNAKLKMEVIQSLALLNVKSASKKLLSLLGTDKNLVKLRAIQALGELKSIRAVPFLVKYLGRESEDFWHFSFNALKKILGNDLEDLLINRLEYLENRSESENKIALKRGIIKALGEIGSKIHKKALLKLAESEFMSIRKEAESALDKIDPQWRSNKSPTS